MRLPSIAIALSLATQLASEPLACPDPLFSVNGGDLSTRERTCTAASEARRTLASCSVVLDRAIDIELVEEFDTDYTTCLGLYHCGENQIQILSPADMADARDREGAFELISDDAYWHSIIAHELTHAAYDGIKCPFSTCIATAEYASFAMQVRSLPREQQSLFGKTVTLRSKPSHDAISEMMLFLSPDHFAKIAWLHFQDQDAPCDYMGLIMSGRDLSTANRSEKDHSFT